MTAVLAVFLVVHGLLHLAVWLPHPSPEPDRPPPFEPDHSDVLTAVHAPPRTAHLLATGLALGAACFYVSAGGLLAFGVTFAALLAVAAAIVGIVLKVLFFHRWLIIGLLLDVGVLTVVFTGWPLSLP